MRAGRLREGVVRLRAVGQVVSDPRLRRDVDGLRLVVRRREPVGSTMGGAAVSPCPLSQPGRRPASWRKVRRSGRRAYAPMSHGAGSRATPRWSGWRQRAVFGIASMAGLPGAARASPSDRRCSGAAPAPDRRRAGRARRPSGWYRGQCLDPGCTARAGSPPARSRRGRPRYPRGDRPLQQHAQHRPAAASHRRSPLVAHDGAPPHADVGRPGKPEAARLDAGIAVAADNLLSSTWSR